VQPQLLLHSFPGQPPRAPLAPECLVVVPVPGEVAAPVIVGLQDFAGDADFAVF